MPGRIQPTFTRSKSRQALGYIGDSHTLNHSLGVTPDKFPPCALEGLLYAQGAAITCRNCGVAGNTTGQILSRVALLTAREVPKIGIIYGGANDPTYTTTVQASPAPTASTFTVAAGKGAGYVAAGTKITVGASSAVVQSVATDAITLTAPLGGAPAAGTAVAIDTTANILAVGQFLATAGTTKMIVLGQHFLNWSSGGDTVATPLSNLAALRTLQQAGATAIDAITGVDCQYINLWQVFADEITAGRVTQGSFSWHVLDMDVHLNAYGSSLIAAALYAKIVSAGWLSSLIV